MLTGTVVWLLVKAHRDMLSGCLTVRTGDGDVAVHLRGRDVVAIEGVPDLLGALGSKLPSADALTGDLSSDIPVCLALGLSLDEVLNAACAELGRVLARLAQDPGAEASFDPDRAAPSGAFPLPKGLLRSFQEGLREVRDPARIEADLYESLDNPLRVRAREEVADLGTIALRTLKLAQSEGTLRGLIAASGRGQPERTRQAWFAVDLLLQLGMISVEGTPVVRRARARPERPAPQAPPPEPPRAAPPPPPATRPLEADDEATDVFAMGADDDEFEEEEEEDDDSSSDEMSLDIAIDDEGASHVVSFTPRSPRRGPSKVAEPEPPADHAGGRHESDEDASDVFAMGGDDDLEETTQDEAIYDEATYDDDLHDVDFSEEELFGELDEDDTFGEPPEDDDSVGLRQMPSDPDETSPGDPVAMLTAGAARPLVERFRALRTANPLVVLGYGVDDVREYVTLDDLRKRANKERGRWHPERYADDGPEARQAAAELSNLVERRYEALKQPRVLSAALREWREQLPKPEVAEADQEKAQTLLVRARQQSTARAWTAALMTVEEALEADPTNVRCRLLDIHCRAVLEEFDVESALANIDALLIKDVALDSEAQLTAGLVLKHAGRSEARARFERAAELDPANNAARHELDFDRAANPQGIGGLISGLFGGD